MLSNVVAYNRIGDFSELQLGHIIEYHSYCNRQICEDPYCVLVVKRLCKDNYTIRESPGNFQLEKDLLKCGMSVMKRYGDIDMDQFYRSIKLWDHNDYNSTCKYTNLHKGERCHIVHWFLCHSPYATRECMQYKINKLCTKYCAVSCNTHCDSHLKIITEFTTPGQIRQHLYEHHKEEDFENLDGDLNFDKLSAHYFYNNYNNFKSKNDDILWEITPKTVVPVSGIQPAVSTHVPDSWDEELVVEETVQKIFTELSVSSTTTTSKPIENKQIESKPPESTLSTESALSTENTLSAESALSTENTLSTESALMLSTHNISQYSMKPMNEIDELKYIKTMIGTKSSTYILKKHFDKLKNQLIEIINMLYLMEDHSNIDIKSKNKKIEVFMSHPFVAISRNDIKDLQNKANVIAAKLKKMENLSDLITP
jgi:hypothetical protein